MLKFPGAFDEALGILIRFLQISHLMVDLSQDICRVIKVFIQLQRPLQMADRLVDIALSINASARL